MFERTIAFGAGRRVRTALLVLIAGVLLSGCYRVPDPAPVQYPDDPRVLNGTWELTVMGLGVGPASFVHAERANRLAIWTGGSVQVYGFREGTGWELEPAGTLSGVSAGSFDSAIEAFVTVTEGAGNLDIRVVPVDGAPVATHSVTLPAGHALEEVATGSGRVFALTRLAGGAWHLTWWDAVSGDLGGTRSVPAPHHGLRASTNGRTLALWDLDAWRVVVIDTAAPHTQVNVRLGACRSNALSEGSADGRWFLVSDCANNVRAADLSVESPTTFGVGVKNASRMTFAAHGGEFVWRDAQGVLHAYDLIERTREELGRLEGETPEYLEPWARAVHLNRAAGLLVHSTYHGTVSVVSLPSGAGTAAEAELPRIALSGAVLDLQAGPLTPDGVGGAGASSYEFSGSFEAMGADVTGEPLPLMGTVYANGLHDYKPGLTPQVWIPRLAGNAVALDPQTDAERYQLVFSTDDRHATFYRGELWDVSDGTSYSVRLERSRLEP